jgi:hypothetical protein
MKEGFIKIQVPGIKVDYCQYKNDKRNGYGIVTWSNGQKYHGNFKDGR